VIGAALQLAASGWPIFPLNGKIPAIAGGRGVLDATTDPGQITEWWTRLPTANIGAGVPDGLLVIDVDPRNGGDLNDLGSGHDPLPPTDRLVRPRRRRPPFVLPLVRWADQ